MVFAGTATAGATGIAALSVLSIAANPLNLPVEAVLVIFMALDPIIDPFRTFLMVLMNMTAASLIASREKPPPLPRGAVPAQKNARHPPAPGQRGPAPKPTR